MDPATAAIALSLALDCFSVAIGTGTVQGRADLAACFKMAASFGAFQSGMLLAGWRAGSELAELAAGYDHWIAFALLAAAAAHMIHGALRGGCSRGGRGTSIALLLTLSIATSIDALVVGFSLSFLNIRAVPASTAAGLAAFTLTVIGYGLGSRIGGAVGGRAGVIGGAILILVGLKILLEHLAA